jgi:hypothetical protein
MEVARMDEDTVLKTAEAYKAFVGSNPTASATFLWACSSIGRASHLHCEGCRFESGLVHHFQGMFWFRHN